MSNFKASKLSKIKIFPFVHLNPSESLSYQAPRWWGRENVSKPPSPCSSIYYKWALKGRLTRMDDLFPEVHYLRRPLCSVCLNRDFCWRGNRRAPLPASGHGSVLAVLGLPVETHSHAGKTTVGERLTAQYSLPLKPNPAPLPKNQSFVCPNFLFPNNAVVSTVLSHPTHTNVHDADADLFYLDMKPLLRCQPKKPSLCWWTASHLTPPVPCSSLSP